MKKTILACLLAALMLMTANAFAETITLGQSGEKALTLTTDQPVIAEVELQDNDNLIAVVSREGVAPVVVSIAPAEFGDGANLNQCTEEELELFAAFAAEQCENYEVEFLETPSGTVFVEINCIVDCTKTIVTIYDDYYIELIQFNEDGTELTEADEAFLQEILQGIWTEIPAKME